MEQQRKRLKDVRQGQLCVAEFDGRWRVLMRLVEFTWQPKAFDPDLLVFSQISGINHTEGHGILWKGLDPEMEVEFLPVTISIPVIRREV